MTSTLEAIGLTYDGTDLQPSTLAFHLQIVSGLDDGFEVRGQDVTIPYADGRIARPRRFDRLVVVLEGFIMGVGDTQDLSRASYRASRRLLSELFSPARTGAILRVDLEDGDIARLTCRPMPGMAVVDVVQSEFATVSIELEAVEQWEGLGS